MVTDGIVVGDDFIASVDGMTVGVCNAADIVVELVVGADVCPKFVEGVMAAWFVGAFDCAGVFEGLERNTVIDGMIDFAVACRLGDMDGKAGRVAELPFSRLLIACFTSPPGKTPEKQ